jgi:AraC-like DNA-binding protein
MPAERDISLKTTHFDFGVSPGARDQFEQWRWGVSPMFDLDIPRSEDAGAYFLNAAGQYFGNMAVARARTVATLFVRGPRVIARSGLDSITVLVYTDGRHHMVAGCVDTIVEPGDIAMYDFSRPVHITASAHSNLSLTIPRRLLEPLLGRLDRLHGLVLRKGAPMHGLLLAHMQQLDAQDEVLTAAAAEQVSEATARIVAAAAQSAGGSAPLVAPGSLVARIRAEIEAQLGNPALDPDWLAAAFGVSRATLYRLFREFGGVRHYIQERRLHESYRALARGTGERVGAIAERLGFPDQASFSRTFRTAYGLSPRDVAHIAQNRDLPPPHAALGFVKLNRWLLGMTA